MEPPTGRTWMVEVRSVGSAKRAHAARITDGTGKEGGHLGWEIDKIMSLSVCYYR